MPTKLPDVSLMNGVVAPQIPDAMKSASAQLSRMGVRHALIGALAAGAWGYPRASKDVDFLVGDEADVVELLRLNDAKQARLYLEQHAPELLPKFDSAASEAEI